MALVVSLVLAGVSAIVVGAVVGYVSHASRMTGYYEGKNICRLAAQSEIELAKAAINYRFELSLNRSARIIGGDSFGSSASSYDWFEAFNGTTAKRTIGAKNTLTLANVVTNNGCVVKVRIGSVEHQIGDQWANVTIVAEATRQTRGGATARSVIEETIRFAQQRSQVFNNAYFVNNFGWFNSGSSTWVNGDIRSNGNMKIDFHQGGELGRFFSVFGHRGDEHVGGGGGEIRVDKPLLVQNVENPREPYRYTDPGQVTVGIVLCEVVVSPAGAYRANFGMLYK